MAKLRMTRSLRREGTLPVPRLSTTATGGGGSPSALLASPSLSLPTFRPFPTDEALATTRSSLDSPTGGRHSLESNPAMPRTCRESLSVTSPTYVGSCLSPTSPYRSAAYSTSCNGNGSYPASFPSTDASTEVTSPTRQPRWAAGGGGGTPRGDVRQNRPLQDGGAGDANFRLYVDTSGPSQPWASGGLGPGPPQSNDRPRDKASVSSGTPSPLPGASSRGDQGRGDQGRGDQGRGDQGRGDQGRAEQGRGEQGRLEQGWGEGRLEYDAGTGRPVGIAPPHPARRRRSSLPDRALELEAEGRARELKEAAVTAGSRRRGGAASGPSGEGARPRSSHSDEGPSGRLESEDGYDGLGGGGGSGSSHGGRGGGDRCETGPLPRARFALGGEGWAVGSGQEPDASLTRAETRPTSEVALTERSSIMERSSISIIETSTTDRSMVVDRSTGQGGGSRDPPATLLAVKLERLQQQQQQQQQGGRTGGIAVSAARTGHAWAGRSYMNSGDAGTRSAGPLSPHQPLSPPFASMRERPLSPPWEEDPHVARVLETAHDVLQVVDRAPLPENKRAFHAAVFDVRTSRPHYFAPGGPRKEYRPVRDVDSPFAVITPEMDAMLARLRDIITGTGTGTGAGMGTGRGSPRRGGGGGSPQRGDGSPQRGGGSPQRTSRSSPQRGGSPSRAGGSRNTSPTKPSPVGPPAGSSSSAPSVSTRASLAAAPLSVSFAPMPTPAYAEGPLSSERPPSSLGDTQPVMPSDEASSSWGTSEYHQPLGIKYAGQDGRTTPPPSGRTTPPPSGRMTPPPPSPPPLGPSPSALQLLSASSLMLLPTPPGSTSPLMLEEQEGSGTAVVPTGSRHSTRDMSDHLPPASVDSGGQRHSRDSGDPEDWDIELAELRLLITRKFRFFWSLYDHYSQLETWDIVGPGCDSHDDEYIYDGIMRSPRLPMNMKTGRRATKKWPSLVPSSKPRDGSPTKRDAVVSAFDVAFAVVELQQDAKGVQRRRTQQEEDEEDLATAAAVAQEEERMAAEGESQPVSPVKHARGKGSRVRLRLPAMDEAQLVHAQWWRLLKDFKLVSLDMPLSRINSLVLAAHKSSPCNVCKHSPHRAVMRVPDFLECLTRVACARYPTGHKGSSRIAARLKHAVDVHLEGRPLGERDLFRRVLYTLEVQEVMHFLRPKMVKLYARYRSPNTQLLGINGFSRFLNECGLIDGLLPIKKALGIYMQVVARASVSHTVLMLLLQDDGLPSLYEEFEEMLGRVALLKGQLPKPNVKAPAVLAKGLREFFVATLMPLVTRALGRAFG
eukprot:jgi/Mesvir1/15871/Mv03416-RA.1